MIINNAVWNLLKLWLKHVRLCWHMQERESFGYHWSSLKLYLLLIISFTCDIIIFTIILLVSGATDDRQFSRRLRAAWWRWPTGQSLTRDIWVPVVLILIVILYALFWLLLIFLKNWLQLGILDDHIRDGLYFQLFPLLYFFFHFLFRFFAVNFFTPIN